MTFQVRLAHRFAADEDPALSQPATVDLSNLVRGFTLVHAEEIALTGGVPLSCRKQRLKWKTSDVEVEAQVPFGAGEPAAVGQERGRSLGARSGSDAISGISMQEHRSGEEKASRDGDSAGNQGEGAGPRLRWPTTLNAMDIKTFRLELIRS